MLSIGVDLAWREGSATRPADRIGTAVPDPAGPTRCRLPRDPDGSPAGPAVAADFWTTAYTALR